MAFLLEKNKALKISCRHNDFTKQIIKLLIM